MGRFMRVIILGAMGLAAALAANAQTPTATPIDTVQLEIKDDPSLHMVAIEALVVEVNEEMTRDLGISYSGNQVRTSSGGATTNGSGVIDGGLINLGQALSTVGVPTLMRSLGGQNRTGSTQRLPGLGFSLTGMNVGTAAISVKLRALLQTGDATIRTRPVAVALHNTPVRIETVNEVPVQGGGGNQLHVDFKKVGVLMDVKPEIVSLRPGVTKLHITKLEVSSVVNLVTSRNISRPVFSRSAAQQTVLTLSEGETFLFGGLKTRRMDHVEDSVPILGSIWLIGRLFRSTHDVERNLDVLFFVTPYILAPGQNIFLPYDFKHQKELGVTAPVGKR